MGGIVVQSKGDPPRVFISYKWQDEERNAWVERLYTDLRTKYGVDAQLDKYEVDFGESFGDYMTSRIGRECDAMLFVITSAAVEAVDQSKSGGVHFEMQLANARRLRESEFRIIGIYREGDRNTAYLDDHRYIDFRNDSLYEQNLKALADSLLRRRSKPELGRQDSEASTEKEQLRRKSDTEIVVTLPGGATMDMVRIEPGTFTMGSPESEEGRDDDEGPQHEVTISRGFYLGKYVITQGQWESVMSTSPWAGKSYVQADPDNPAVYISWEDMQTFIDSLNAGEGSDVYRLPTEAEWEYACRAGTTTLWSFGDDEGQLGQYAWYYDNAWTIIRNRYAHAVGTKEPNPWGLYDMHGNVWEWCHDDMRQYPSDPLTEPLSDPRGPTTSGSDRVFRGGDFAGYARYVRLANRLNASPGARYFGVGARLLRQGQ